jgi:hypothetical protein
MPFEFSDHTSPSGMFYMRIDASGEVHFEDAKALTDRLELPKYHLGKVLSVVESGTDYKPKARKHFQHIQKFSALAAVVTSPILRTAINLMLRLMHDGSGAVRLFTNEDEALAWLEEQPLREPE